MNSYNRSIPSLDTMLPDHKRTHLQTSKSLPNENSSTSLVSVGGAALPLKNSSGKLCFCLTSLYGLDVVNRTSLSVDNY